VPRRRGPLAAIVMMVVGCRYVEVVDLTS